VPVRRVILWKFAVWIGCLSPFVWLLVQGFGLFGMSLGANPVETVLHTTGKSGLNILFVSLAVTPVRVMTGINQLVRIRRPLGLFSFFYIVLHFTTYSVLDLQLKLDTLYTDITERPYITFGMLALVGMIPLAITSTSGMQRRLGRRWQLLHRLVYVIAICALVHFIWQVKIDLREPLVYAAILAILLGYRIARAIKLKRRRGQTQAQTQARTQNQ
jgi:sulfoxide reductase heme-binding subunit YedZ